MAETIHPIAEDTEVRVTHDSVGLAGSDSYRAGMKYTVGVYVSEEESDWEIPEGSGKAQAFYWLNSDDGTEAAVPAKHVEALRSAEEMAARTLPTLGEARKFLRHLCGEEGASFSIDEVDYSGVDATPVLLHGTAHNGLPVTIVVQVLSVEEGEI